MKKPGVLGLTLVFLAAFCSVALCASIPFSAKADDGLVLKGTLYLGELQPVNGEPVVGVDACVPTVILLPMMANDRKSWGDFPKKLSAAGYNVLALDQRGHGESVWRGKKKVSYTQFSNSEFAKMVTDLDAVMEDLYGQRMLDTSRVAIYGASIGANVALVYASKHSNVKPVVLLSPGMDYRGITTAEAAASYGNRPALVVASKKDSYSASSAQKLAGKIGSSATLKIYDGSEHGTRIFAEEKDFERFLLDWTIAHFPAGPPPQK